MRPPWPAPVDDLIGSPDGPIVRRGPARWTVGPFVVSRLDGPPATDDRARDQARDAVDRQVALLGRLAPAADFAVPEVVGHDGPWLVLRDPDGLRADRPEDHPEPGQLSRAVGAGLRALHDLPPTLLDGASTPPAEVDGWAEVIERCRVAVEQGRVVPDALPRPYDRYTPERLLEFLIEAGAAGERATTGGPGRRPVLCHGHPGLDRILVGPDGFVGFDGFEQAMVADPHIDLAVAHLAIFDRLGAEAVIGLYEGYGRDPDLAELDRAILAARLLGPAQAAAGT